VPQRPLSSSVGGRCSVLVSVAAARLPLYGPPLLISRASPSQICASAILGSLHYLSAAAANDRAGAASALRRIRGSVWTGSGSVELTDGIVTGMIASTAHRLRTSAFRRARICRRSSVT